MKRLCLAFFPTHKSDDGLVDAAEQQRVATSLDLNFKFSSRNLEALGALLLRR
jgi:hypothetical protein